MSKEQHQQQQKQRQPQDYRVVVHSSVAGGQLVRAAVGDTEWLVRVPDGAVTEDTFLFRLTEEDWQAAAASSEPIVIATAVVLERSILRTLKNSSLPIQEILTEPYRVACMGLAFVLAFFFGIVLGVLFYTRDYATTSR